MQTIGTTYKKVDLVNKIETNIRGFNQLRNFYTKCARYSNETLQIGINKLEYFDANLSAILGAILLKLHKENNLLFVIDKRYLGEKFGVLNRNGFIKGLSEQNIKTKDEIPFGAFGKKDDQSFLKYIQNELLNHESLCLNDRDKIILTFHFLELFTNVEKHAKTDEPLFACGQFYKKQNILKFTLIDTGIGYLQPIKKHTNNEIICSKEAIAWALKGNSSIKGITGGLGIKGLLQFCEETDSKLHIITGNSYYCNVNKPIKIKEVQEFCGSIIHFEFNCNYLSKKS